jgi:hypothetical protein
MHIENDIRNNLDKKRHLEEELMYIEFRIYNLIQQLDKDWHRIWIPSSKTSVKRSTPKPAPIKVEGDFE